MEQSAVPHQLRLLRNLGLVTEPRSERSIVYRLYDNHVANCSTGPSTTASTSDSVGRPPQR
jgi:DNA-binding transcriptional ArsR family regulator